MKTLLAVLLWSVMLMSEQGFAQQTMSAQPASEVFSAETPTSDNVVTETVIPPPNRNNQQADTRSITAVSTNVTTTNPVLVIVALFFIIMLIFLMAWGLKRMGAVSLMGNPSMKVVAGLSVGTREKVILIEVGGKQFLLGIAPGRISSLHCFEQPVVNAPQSQRADFSEKIKQFIQQGATTKKQ